MSAGDGESASVGFPADFFGLSDLLLLVGLTFVDGFVALVVACSFSLNCCFRAGLALMPARSFFAFAFSFRIFGMAVARRSDCQVYCSTYTNLDFQKS